jgi:hypothetical protein
MNRRLVAILAFALLLIPAALALAKQPQIKPKTGTYKGKEVGSENPGVLKVEKAGHGFSVSKLSLTFHIDCDSGQAERDVPIVVSGKLHKMTVTSSKGTPVGTYGFSKQKQTGGSTGTSTMYNFDLDFLSSKKAEVHGIYTEDTNDANGDPLTGCTSGQATWNLKH